MSSKYPSPLLGYNHNIRHKGKVFHVQTEDSGVKYGHIITHLFMDGGRILKSVKTSYAEYVGGERVTETIREMMQQQHKAMVIALREGRFDHVAEGSADASQRTQAIAADSPPMLSSDSSSAPGAKSSSLPSPLPRVAAAQAAGPREPSEAPPTLRQLPSLKEDLALDITALERATAAASASSPVLRSASDLPPPPADLFRERAANVKRPGTPPPARATHPGPGPPPLPKPGSGSMPVRRPQTAASAAPERRYAPTRPASVFGQARPEQGKTIFGEDLLSDKSLDEVILSYLAEDVDAEKK